MLLAGRTALPEGMPEPVVECGDILCFSVQLDPWMSAAVCLIMELLLGGGSSGVL